MFFNYYLLNNSFKKKWEEIVQKKIPLKKKKVKKPSFCLRANRYNDILFKKAILLALQNPNYGRILSFIKETEKDRILRYKLHQRERLFMNQFVRSIFVGTLTKRGYRLRALKIFNNVLKHIKRFFFLRSEMEKEDLEALEIVRKIISPVKPCIGLYTKRVGGVFYHLPHPISIQRSYKVAVHWTINSALVRKGSYSLDKKIFAELLDTYRGRSLTRRKLKKLYSVASDQRVFAHYLRL